MAFKDEHGHDSFCSVFELSTKLTGMTQLEDVWSVQLKRNKIQKQKTL